ncbi:hypothetical protein HK405_011216 [Cladochytrium tenue]|nr:hypothetical protein HK405_011216 [Cladochytrium tenue]
MLVRFAPNVALAALAAVTTLSTASISAAASTTTLFLTVTQTVTVSAGAAAATTSTAAAAGLVGTTTATAAAAAASATVTSSVNPGFSSGWCSGSGQFITQLNLVVSMFVTASQTTACEGNGNGPMAECGLPSLAMAVYDATTGAAVNVVSWTGGDQTFSTNSLFFTEQDDMPYYGGQLTLDIACDYVNNLPSAVSLSFAAYSLTSTVDLTIDDAGDTIPAAVAVVTSADAASTTPAAAVGATVATSAAAGATSAVAATSTTTTTSAAAVAAASATVTSTINPGFTGSGWCSGSGQYTTQLSTTVSVAITSTTTTACTGTNPMAECGLPTLHLLVTQGGAAVDVVSWSGGDGTFTGNALSLTEADDMPYYGGALTLGIACDYSTNLPSAVVLEFSAAAVTTTVDVTVDDAGNTIPATVVVATA